MSTQTTGPRLIPASDDVAITLDNGQFNLLVSARGIAYSTCRQALPSVRELIGQPEEYSALSHQIMAQLPGEGSARAAARVRIAVREG